MDPECRRMVCNVRWLFHFPELGYGYAEHHRITANSQRQT